MLSYWCMYRVHMDWCLQPSHRLLLSLNTTQSFSIQCTQKHTPDVYPPLHYLVGYRSSSGIVIQGGRKLLSSPSPVIINGITQYLDPSTTTSSHLPPTAATHAMYMYTLGCHKGGKKQNDSCGRHGQARIDKSSVRIWASTFCVCLCPPPDGNGNVGKACMGEMEEIPPKPINKF